MERWSGATNGKRRWVAAVAAACFVLLVWRCRRGRPGGLEGPTADEGGRRWPQLARRHPQFAFDRTRPLPEPHLKTILLWNRWFDMDDAFFFGTGREPFVRAGCEVDTCYVSNEKNRFPPSEYDAVLFFFPMMTDVPFTYSRNQRQLYVFVNEEPPVTPSRVDLSQLNGFFNLTMTYRADSDIHWPYGSIRPVSEVETVVVDDDINYAQGKTKLVAWFVSNCDSASKRELYVAQLKKYVDVDVYGRCGDRTCWAGDQEACYAHLERHYKFYLSFENSLCRDYVTEKFFQVLDRRVVPVVYGAFNYSVAAPAGSYIDATQMGAKRLAKTLLAINASDRLYNEFFRWKKHFRVVKERRQLARPAFCSLCRRLHQPQQTVQIYQDLKAWWGQENHCHNSGVFVSPFKRFTFADVPPERLRSARIVVGAGGADGSVHARDSL